jgi:hypothetical protein
MLLFFEVIIESYGLVNLANTHTCVPTNNDPKYLKTENSRLPVQMRSILTWDSQGRAMVKLSKSVKTFLNTHEIDKSLLLVKMKEKKLLKIQPLPKVLRVQAIRATT